MRSIKKSGIVYLPKKDEDETNVNFEKRKKFIAEMKPKNQEEYNKSLVLSRIIINILLLIIYNLVLIRVFHFILSIIN